MNQQNAALNVSIKYFHAETNNSPLTTQHLDFREIIAAAQANMCATVAYRNEFDNLKGSVYLQYKSSVSKNGIMD
jgi:hypothetical protein